MSTGSRIVPAQREFKADEPLKIRYLSRERRCNSRMTKRAVKYFWRVENTDYGKRSIFLNRWNRRLRKWTSKLRRPR